MPGDDNPIVYELNLETDAAGAAAFDTWLGDHVADVLQFAGFQSAEILLDPVAPPGTARRQVRYRVRDRSSLDAFLASPVARLATERWAGTARALVHTEEFLHGAETANCLNCGKVLRGQHCAHCGQRARIRVLSLWSLLRDAAGDFFEWDSRLWRTLRPLAVSPGLLTQEFLRGRRARYMPPFRMYLVLSVVFFLLATSVNGLRVEIDDNNVAQSNGAATTPPPVLDPQRQELADTILARLPPQDREKARAGIDARIARIETGQLEGARKFIENPCAPENVHLGDGAFEARYGALAIEACKKVIADSQGFDQAMYQNIPRTMVAFLPMIALVMYVLYLGSGRFYVEHLVFFVHYHALFFLAGLPVMLLERSGRALSDTLAGQPLLMASTTISVLFAIYAAVYLYLAMRRVYGQGRLLTLFKFSVLGIGYLVGLAVTILGLMIYTSLTL